MNDPKMARFIVPLSEKPRLSKGDAKTGRGSRFSSARVERDLTHQLFFSILCVSSGVRLPEQ